MMKIKDFVPHHIEECLTGLDPSMKEYIQNAIEYGGNIREPFSGSSDQRIMKTDSVCNLIKKCNFTRILF